MSKSDFNILIGVDMTNAEKTIKDSIKSIGDNFKLELGLVIDSKSRFFKQIKSIQNLFKNLGKIDLDFGVGNEADQMKKKLKGLADVDLSSAGEELAKSMDDAKKKIEEVRQAYKSLMQVTDRTTNDGGKSQTVKAGDKFSNSTKTTITNPDNSIIDKAPVNSRNFDALNGYVDKAMTKIDSLSNVTNKYSEDISKLAIRLAQLHEKLANGDEGFGDEVKEINNLLEYYNKLEDEMVKATKVRETQAKEAIKWANKLAEVERKGFANPASRKKMGRLIGDLDGDFKDLDSLQKKLAEIQNQYAKVQGQEKDVSFRRDTNSKMDKAKKTGEKLIPSLADPADKAKLDASLDDVKNAKNQVTLENALKRVNAQYDEMLRKQEEAIKQSEDMSNLHQHLADTENERARLAHDEQVKQNTVKENTGKVSDRDNTLNDMRSRMSGSGFVDTKDFDAVEEKLRELGRLAQSEFIDNLDIEKELKDVDKMMEKISERYTDFDSKARKIRGSIHDWNKEITQIKNGGFVNESEFTKIRSLMKGLSADSKTYEKDLKNITGKIARMNTLSEKRQERQETRDISKGRNNAKIQSMRGSVPDYILNDVKGMNDMLDFSSSKKDIALIEDEMKRLVNLQEMIAQAGKDKVKYDEAILDYQQQAVRTSDKYQDSLNEIVHQVQRQINDAQKRNDIEQEAIRIQREINALRQRGTEITYDEGRAIQQQLLALRQYSQRQRDIESDNENRRVTTQRLTDRLASNGYRATRGLSENSSHRRELQEMIDNIDAQVRGLGNHVGDEFDRATRRIEEQMNDLNRRSRELRDEDQRRRGSIGGQLITALKKVPIWTTAMELFYGSLQQIQQGFQQILDLDKAMINLQKVTEASQMQLDSFKTTASEIGRELGVVATEVVKATTGFQKLGYTLEQATTLGKNSILYANVGDMSVENAGENIVSTIKGFGIEVDEQGNNVRNIVDMYNEVGNNFAISSEGIGEALKRSSSVMQEAGNSIQESVGLITSANAVIQDPKKVGNGLKTIAMRLRGVSEEGDDVSELVPQLQRHFDRINKEFGLMGDNALNVMDELDPTKFKSTFEIFKDLTKVWGKLSDIEQANLVETMGGKHQGVVVSAIINNWKDAEAAAQTASNSAGSASREFEDYMDGFEYRIGKLKNALEHFWTTLVDEDAIKDLITALTAIVDLMTKAVETFGAGNIAVVLTGLFAFMGSKGLRDAIKAGIVLKSIADTFKGLGGWIARIAPMLLRFSGWLAVLLAIGKAGELIVKAINAESKARKEKLKILDDEIAKLEEADKKYRDLFDENTKNDKLDRFERLQYKGSSRSSEEEQEFFELTQKIRDQFPELIAYYDEYHRAIAKSADEIRRLRKENEKNNLNAEIEQQDIKIEEADFKQVNKSLSDLANNKKQIESTMGEESIANIMKDYISKEMQAMNYSNVVQSYNNKLNAEYAKMSEDQKNNINEFMMKMKWDFPYSTDKNVMLEKIDLFISQSKEKRSMYVKEQKKLKTTMITTSEEFNKLFDTAFSIETRKMGIEADTNKFKFIDDLRRNMLVNIQDLGVDFKEIIQNVPKYFNDAINVVENEGIDFDKLIAVNPETSEQTIAEIDKIIQKLKLDEITPEESSIVKTLDEIRMSHEQAYLQFKNKHLVPISIEKDVLPQVDTFIDSISDLDSAYRDLADGGELSLSTTMDLISKHPDLIKSMKMENGVLKLTKDSIKELAKIKEEEFKEDLRMKLESAKEAKKRAEEEIKAQRDIAKSYVESNTVRMSLVYDPQTKIDELNKELNEKEPSKEPMLPLDTLNAFPPNALKKPIFPPNALENSMLTNEGKPVRTVAEINKEIEYWESLAKKNINQKDLDMANESIAALEKLLDQDWSSQLGNITGGSDQDKKDIQDGYYVVDKYANSIRHLNTQIEEQQRLQSQNSEWSNAYRSALNEEIYLTNMKKKAIDGEISSLKKQIETKSIKKKGLVTVDANGNENKTARLIQAELEQEIQQAREKLSELEGESTQAGTRSNELAFSMVNSRLEAFNMNREMLTDDIAYQEYAMSLYDETSQAYRDHAEEKIKLLQEQMKSHKDELALLEEEKSSNKSLNATQISELNALIRAKREGILEMAKTIQEVNTLIANSGLEEYLFKINSESEKYEKEIEKIQNNIKNKIDDEKIKDYDNHISYLQEIISLHRGQYIDATNHVQHLKNQLELYKDNKEMVEKITSEIKQWEEKMYDAETAVRDVNQEVKDVYEQLAEDYVDLYKEQLELMSEAEAKRFENMIEAQEKAHESRMKQIEKESNALQEAYDKQIELIDRAESKRTHENDLGKLQKETNELKKQIDLLSMDDSYEAKNKKSDLSKELAEKEGQILEFQHDREIELRKESLSDDLESEKEKIDKKKENMEDENEKLIDSLQKSAEARQKYWEDELNNENKFAELRKQVLDGNFNEMLANVETWSTGVQSEMGILGQTITENFTSKVKNAIDALTELKSAKNIGALDKTIENSKPKNVDGDSKPQAELPKDNQLNTTDKDKTLIKQMSDNAKAWGNASAEEKLRLEKDNQDIGLNKLSKSIGANYKNGKWFDKNGKPLFASLDTGGYTGEWSGNEGKLAMLHKKELVLNENQTKHILDTARIVEKIKSIIPSLNLLNGIPSIKTAEPAVASGTTENNEYNIEVIVQGNADKKVADTVADQIVNKIKRTKGGRF